MGISVGGGLVVGLVFEVCDKKFVFVIRKLVLIYFMFDDRMCIGEDYLLNEYLIWINKKNEIGWQVYLGGVGVRIVSSFDVSVYVVLVRVEDLFGLLLIYFDVGGLDLFKDEVNVFGVKLFVGKVDVEFYFYLGVFYVWEWLSYECFVMQKVVNNRVFVFCSLQSMYQVYEVWVWWCFCFCVLIGFGICI